MRDVLLASEARVFEQTKVTDVVRDGGQVVLTTPQGRVRADRVVLDGEERGSIHDELLHAQEVTLGLPLSALEDREPCGGQSGSGASQRLEQWSDATFCSGIRMWPLSSMWATSST